MAFGRLLDAAKRLSTGRPPDVSAELSALFARAPVPVVWLIGKAQAGKSSVVRTITGLDDIEIGQGYHACTRSSDLYAYPAESMPLLRFLDTRGLFEAGYQAEDDIRVFEEQAHVLLVVVKATDHALGGFVELLQQIKRRHREWPVIVVQTCLHELYGTQVTSHPEPYPFLWPVPSEVRARLPKELWDSLEYQRHTLAPFAEHFVPVDFTLPADGFDPPDYGRQQLLDAVADALPEVAWNLISRQGLGAVGGTFWRRAQPHIAAYSLGCGIAAAAPIPFSDIPLVTAAQLKMLHSIAGIYGQRMTYERLAEVLGALGYGYVSRLGWKGILKFVPGGNIAYGSYCAAVTYALGNAFCAYFQYLHDGLKPDRDALRALFNERLAIASGAFGGDLLRGKQQSAGSEPSENRGKNPSGDNAR